ncbi:RING finger protein [Armadillidium nasatum]|uniref:RING finger protein n=1 Tax=Armadillidium nasatum TaxID=96803 RepID=A0A5N5TLD6_9CRUS|nr:RING finger protein [Armadillidium nasatum]
MISNTIYNTRTRTLKIIFRPVQSAVIQGLMVLLLPLEQLVSLYMHYLTVAILAAADTFSRYYIEAEKGLSEQWPDYGTVSFQGFSNMLMLQKSLFDSSNDIETLFLRQQVAAIVFHTLVATLVTFFLDLEYNKDKILLLVYLVPVFGRLSGCPIGDLHLTHNFASCFVIFLTVQYIFLCVPHVFRFLKSVYINFTLLAHWYGPVGLFMKLWGRLFVPVQLLLFWLMLFITQIYSHILPEGSKKSVYGEVRGINKSPLESSLIDIKMLVSNIEEGISGQISENGGSKTELIGNMWYLIMIQSAAEVCYTPLMLGGACVTVSYASRGILILTRIFVAGSNAPPLPEDLAHSGWTEGITMALLAIQTSLLSMPMPERLAVLSIIILIVVSSLIQSMYELVEPLVLSLSTQGLAPLSKHLRACILCLVLLLLPLYMVYTFTVIFDQDFWLLIVASTSIMTSVQALGLIAMYILLTWDAASSKPWPSLDDFIYYTRATTRVFEFIVAVLVVGAGVKESFLGEWSWISALVLLIHCYFNVWQRLQQGWNSFLLRVEAANKISALPVATSQQLEKYSDLCAICYSEMSSARVTKCSHLFHEACLRKWLYIQGKCPLCHRSINIHNEEDNLNERTSQHYTTERDLHNEPNIEAEIDFVCLYKNDCD